MIGASGTYIREGLIGYALGGIQAARRPIDSLLHAVTQALPKPGEQAAAAGKRRVTMRWCG
jgi:hypothetical protein